VNLVQAEPASEQGAGLGDLAVVRADTVVLDLMDVRLSASSASTRTAAGRVDAEMTLVLTGCHLAAGPIE
jgi:hypothetical protein